MWVCPVSGMTSCSSFSNGVKKDISLSLFPRWSVEKRCSFLCSLLVIHFSLDDDSLSILRYVHYLCVCRFSISHILQEDQLYVFFSVCLSSRVSACVRLCQNKSKLTVSWYKREEEGNPVMEEEASLLSPRLVWMLEVTIIYQFKSTTRGGKRYWDRQREESIKASHDIIISGGWEMLHHHHPFSGYFHLSNWDVCPLLPSSSPCCCCIVLCLVLLVLHHPSFPSSGWLTGQSHKWREDLTDKADRTSFIGINTTHWFSLSNLTGDIEESWCVFRCRCTTLYIDVCKTYFRRILLTKELLDISPCSVWIPFYWSALNLEIQCGSKMGRNIKLAGRGYPYHPLLCLEVFKRGNWLHRTRQDW